MRREGDQSEKRERVGSGARRALNHVAVCVEHVETLTPVDAQAPRQPDGSLHYTPLKLDGRLAH